MAIETDAMQFLNENDFIDYGKNPYGYYSNVDYSNDESVSKHLSHFEVREKFIKKYGFAILDNSTIEVLKEIGNFLEVGAGSGYWSYELQKNGIDIICTGIDSNLYDKSTWKNKYTAMENLTAIQAVKKYPTRNLLIVWGSYKGTWTSEMLKRFKGEYVCYVGEGVGGCTCDDLFHEILDTEYELVKEHAVPRFFGINDGLDIYKRKIK